MEENQIQPPVGQGYGIAGLIIGIIAFLVSFIPCLGFGPLAIVLGCIAVILSLLSYFQARKTGRIKGLLVAALVISIVAVVAGVTRYLMVQSIKQQAKAKVEHIEKWSEDFESAIDQLNEEGSFDEMENALDELEGDSTSNVDKAIEDALNDQSDTVDEK